LAAAAPEVVSSVAAEVRAWSKHVLPACRRLGLACFDVSRDFEGAMADAAAALIAGIPPA
jgi:hypothetical protein